MQSVDVSHVVKSFADKVVVNDLSFSVGQGEIFGLIGPKTWKVIHYASFFTFMIAVMHGLASGSDTSLPWAHTVYWIFGSSFLFLTIYRLIAGVFPQKAVVKSRPVVAPRQGAEH